MSKLSDMLMNRTSPGVDPNMPTTAQQLSTRDRGLVPTVTDEELHQQLLANWFHLQPEQRDINSPYMQALKAQMESNRMQLMMQQAKNPKREQGA